MTGLDDALTAYREGQAAWNNGECLKDNPYLPSGGDEKHPKEDAKLCSDWVKGYTASSEKAAREVVESIDTHREKVGAYVTMPLEDIDFILRKLNGAINLKVAYSTDTLAMAHRVIEHYYNEVDAVLTRLEKVLEGSDDTQDTQQKSNEGYVFNMHERADVEIAKTIRDRYGERIHHVMVNADTFVAIMVRHRTFVDVEMNISTGDCIELVEMYDDDTESATGRVMLWQTNSISPSISSTAHFYTVSLSKPITC